MDKAFTLRLVRCLLFGIGAFVMILAFDITIRSQLDVAGYVLGAGALWYVFEIIVMSPRKRTPSAQPPENTPLPKKTSKKTKSPLGDDHFD
ncbi:MAG: hypothetical protein RIC29_13840 [Rhodospirillaceae bacterium]